MTRGAGSPAPGPRRTCIGCGSTLPQSELVRYHAADGLLVVGPGPGRGAYTCRRRRCFEQALVRRAFARRLRGSVAVPAGLADGLPDEETPRPATGVSSPSPGRSAVDG